MRKIFMGGIAIFCFSMVEGSEKWLTEQRSSSLITKTSTVMAAAFVGGSFIRNKLNEPICKKSYVIDYFGDDIGNIILEYMAQKPNIFRGSQGEYIYSRMIYFFLPREAQCDYFHLIQRHMAEIRELHEEYIFDKNDDFPCIWDYDDSITKESINNNLFEMKKKLAFFYQNFSYLQKRFAGYFRVRKTILDENDVEYLHELFINPLSIGLLPEKSSKHQTTRNYFYNLTHSEIPIFVALINEKLQEGSKEEISNNFMKIY